MFEQLGPKWLTDVSTGHEAFINFYGMPSKQTNMVWINETGDIAILRPGLKKWLFTTFFNHAGPLMVNILLKKNTYDQLPLHRNGTAKSCCGCPGITTKCENHKNIVTPWQCCSPQSKGHNSVSEGRKVISPAPPILLPWLSTMWVLAVFFCFVEKKKFLRIQDLARAVNSQLHVISPFGYHNTFQKWLEWLRLCVDSNAEYLENPLKFNCCKCVSHLVLEL